MLPPTVPGSLPSSSMDAARAAPLHPLAAATRLALASLVTAGIMAPAGAQTASPDAADRPRTLPEVQVTADGDAGLPATIGNGHTARGGRLGLLGNTDTLNAPLSATSYTSQMVQDQQAVTIADIVKNDSSVRLSGHSGDQLDSFFIRGFPVGDQNSGEIAFDGVYGIAPNYRVLADYAERIELVKGPAALLFGMSPASSVGGTINIVPKRATSARSHASPPTQDPPHRAVARST